MKNTAEGRKTKVSNWGCWEHLLEQGPGAGGSWDQPSLAVDRMGFAQVKQWRSDAMVKFGKSLELPLCKSLEKARESKLSIICADAWEAVEDVLTDSWVTVKTNALKSELRERVQANTVWKLGYSMRPSRSVWHFLSWGCKLHRQAFHTLAVSLYLNYFTPLPRLPVKMSMNTEDGIWLSVEGVPTTYRLHFLRMFTYCCDRKAWDSCKQSWVRNKKCNFSCSFSRWFIYPSIHHLPWIGSHFPVQKSKKENE